MFYLMMHSTHFIYSYMASILHSYPISTKFMFLPSFYQVYIFALFLPNFYPAFLSLCSCPLSTKLLSCFFKFVFLPSFYQASILRGMGRLIAVHGYRGFKSHGSVHRRQFAYRVFFLTLFKWRIVIVVKGYNCHTGERQRYPDSISCVTSLKS